MLSHAHLTLDRAEEAIFLIGGKLTTVYLENKNRKQVDDMLTIYDVENLDFYIKQLADNGISPKRIKVEEEFSDNDRLYTELHIKVLVTNERLLSILKTAEHLGCVPSRNILEKQGNLNVQFVNKRFYNKVAKYDLDRVVNKFREWTMGMDRQILEVKYENCIKDTNIDKWWA